MDLKSSSTKSLTEYGRKGRRNFPPLGLLLPIGLLIALASLPLIYIGLRASEVGLEQAWYLIIRPRTFFLLRNTVELMVMVTLTSTLLGLSTAWCVERSNLPGKKIWNVLFTLPLAVPSFISSYTWVSISSNLEHFGGAVLILTLSSYPLVYLIAASALRGMDPALEESARSLGLGPWATFWRVTLPGLRPALSSGGLLVALHMLAEFGALAQLRFETFTTAIMVQYQVAFNGAAAAMLSLVLLLLSLGILLVERMVRGGRSYARIGSGSARVPKMANLGRLRYLALGGFSLLVFLAVVVPLGSLMFWLFTGSSAAFPLEKIFSALTSTLYLGFGGAFLTVAFALPLVLMAVRSRGWFSTLADRLPYLIHCIPVIVIGLSLVFFGIHFARPFYQTVFLLLIAYMMLFLPLAQSSLRGAIEQVPPRLEEIARTLGRGKIKVFFTVTLPIIAPGIGAGAALVCVQIMKELTATLLLRPTPVKTLAFQIWDHASNLEYAAAAPYAVLLILFSGLPVYVLTLGSFRRKPGVVTQ